MTTTRHTNDLQLVTPPPPPPTTATASSSPSASASSPTHRLPRIKRYWGPSWAAAPQDQQQQHKERVTERAAKRERMLLEKRHQQVKDRAQKDAERIARQQEERKLRAQERFQAEIKKQRELEQRAEARARNLIAMRERRLLQHERRRVELCERMEKWREGRQNLLAAEREDQQRTVQEEQAHMARIRRTDGVKAAVVEAARELRWRQEKAIMRAQARTMEQKRLQRVREQRERERCRREDKKRLMQGLISYPDAGGEVIAAAAAAVTTKKRSERMTTHRKAKSAAILRGSRGGGSAGDSVQQQSSPKKRMSVQTSIRAAAAAASLAESGRSGGTPFAPNASTKQDQLTMKRDRSRAVRHQPQAHMKAAKAKAPKKHTRNKKAPRGKRKKTHGISDDALAHDDHSREQMVAAAATWKRKISGLTATESAAQANSDNLNGDKGTLDEQNGHASDAAACVEEKPPFAQQNSIVSVTASDASGMHDQSVVEITARYLFDTFQKQVDAVYGSVFNDVDLHQTQSGGEDVGITPEEGSAEKGERISVDNGDPKHVESSNSRNDQGHAEESCVSAVTAAEKANEASSLSPSHGGHSKAVEGEQLSALLDKEQPSTAATAESAKEGSGDAGGKEVAAGNDEVSRRLKSSEPVLSHPHYGVTSAHVAASDTTPRTGTSESVVSSVDPKGASATNVESSAPVEEGSATSVELSAPVEEAHGQSVMKSGQVVGSQEHADGASDDDEVTVVIEGLRSGAAAARPVEAAHQDTGPPLRQPEPVRQRRRPNVPPLKIKIPPSDGPTRYDYSQSLYELFKSPQQVKAEQEAMLYNVSDTEDEVTPSSTPMQSRRGSVSAPPSMEAVSEQHGDEDEIDDAATTKAPAVTFGVPFQSLNGGASQDATATGSTADEQGDEEDEYADDGWDA